jgi:Zn-dependent peptidase ImmA (M78 family)
MAERVMAKANPELLRWARETRGFPLDLAASSLNIDKDLLAQVERGEAQLTFAKLRKAADVYKRPLAVFFLPHPPEAKPRVTDFRRLPEAVDHPYSPALLLQMRRLSHKRSVAMRLREFARATDWGFVGSVDLGSDPEAVSARVRELLKLPVEVSARWRDKYARLNGWRNALEAVGLLVFVVQRVSVGEMRGMSIAEAPFPLIAINRGDTPGARLFSLLHELGHVLLGRSSLCDDGDDVDWRNNDEARRVEVFCNAVSAAVLMPRDQVVAIAAQIRPDRQLRWDEAMLRELADGFGVSAEAMLRRLRDLSLARRDEYDAFRRMWQACPAPSEDGDEEDEDRNFGEYGHDRVMRTQGKNYVRLVLEALHGEAITPGDAADYLDMKLGHLAALQEHAG